MKRKGANLRIGLKVSEQAANNNVQQVGQRRDESQESSGSESPSSSSSLSSDSMSIDGSCVSSEAEETSSRRREEAPMVLVGCPGCLMYVMLSEANPKCPRCHSTVMLDFLDDQTSSETDD